MSTTPPLSEFGPGGDWPPVLTRVAAALTLWVGLLVALFAPLLLVGFVAGVLLAAASFRVRRTLPPVVGLLSGGRVSPVERREEV